MPLSGLTYLNNLCLGFVTDLCGSGVCRLRNRATALLGGRREQLLRERAKVGVEMPSGMCERTIECVTNVVVERHSRNYTAANFLWLSGLDGIRDLSW